MPVRLIVLAALVLGPSLSAQDRTDIEWHVRMNELVAELANDDAAKRDAAAAEIRAGLEALAPRLADEPSRSASAAYYTGARQLLKLGLVDGGPTEVGRLVTAAAREAIRIDFPHFAIQLAVEQSGRLAEVDPCAAILLVDALVTETRDAWNHPLARQNRHTLLYRAADLWRSLGEPDMALERLREFESALLPEQHIYSPCDALALRAQVEMQRGLPERAAAHIDALSEAISSFDEPPDRLRMTLRRCEIDLALATEDHASAAAMAEESLAEWPEGDGSALFRLRLAQARLARQRDDPSDARVARDELAALVRAGTLSPSRQLVAEATLAEFALLAGDAEEALALAAGVGPRIGAPHRGEGARLRARVVALRGAAALASGAGPKELESILTELREAYGAFLMDWERTSTRGEGIAFLHYGGRCAVVSELMRLHVAVGEGAAGHESALAELMRAQAMGTVSRHWTAVVPAIADVQRLAGPNGGMLAYLMAPDRVHVIAIDREAVEHAEVAIDATTLYDTGLDFVELVRRSPVHATDLESRRSEWRRLGEVLIHALLPPPVRARVDRWSEVTIVGADQLGLMLFEALPYDESTLGRRRAVGYLPSIPLGVRRLDMPRRSAGSDVDVAFLGAPDHGDALRGRFALEPLVLDGREVARMLAAYDDTPSVRLGEAATAHELGLMMASRPRVLHIWTHGVYDSSRERPAGLALVSQVFRSSHAEASTAPDVVVLSACGAALGPIRRGEDGVAHLGGAFLKGGARVVVLPSSDVEEEAARRLGETFHHRLRGYGDEPAEAMRAARDELASDPRYEDPFYDSTIHVFGLPHEAPFPEAAAMRPRHPLAAIGVGFLLALVAAAAVALRRRRLAATR